MSRVSPLKIEIVKRGLVQADVAEAAGISESRLSRIVNQRVRPFDYEVKVLSKILEVPREEIFA